MDVLNQLKNAVQLSIEKEKEEFESMNSYIVFGAYIQKDNGIYRNDESEFKVANILLKSVVVHIDELGLFEPKIDVEYINLLYDKTITVENKSKEELKAHFKSDIAFKSDETIMPFIENVLHSDWDGVIYEKGVFIEGFFYHNGKIIDNTLNKDLEYTMDDVKDAIRLVNEIVSNRGSAIPNDCTVFRFMLCSPFMYAMKQIGFGKSNYGLILYGKPQTSKTGSVSNFSWLYSEPSERNKVVSTLSVFGSRLEESTLPSLIDESYTFISNTSNHDPIKSSIYELLTRQTKSKNDNKKIDSYKALSIPIFTYNEHYEVANYFGRRFTLCYYDESMIIYDEDRKEFDINFIPSSSESPLKKLRYLGAEFSKRMIPYFERKDSDLINLEELTVKILKKLSFDVGESFKKEVFEIQESNNDTVVDLKSKVRSGLNELFRHNHRKRYDRRVYYAHDFEDCADNKEISFLYRKPTQNVFVIHKKDFVDTVSSIVNESLNLNEILTYLEIDCVDVKQQKVYGQNIGLGFEIEPSELEFKVFGIRTHESSEIYLDEPMKVDVENVASEDGTDNPDKEMPSKVIRVI